MNKRINSNKKFILGVLVGVLISTITVYAVNYAANEIPFTTSKNSSVKTVKDALDDLYGKDFLNSVDVFWDSAGVETQNINKTWTVEEDTTYVISIHTGRGYNDGTHTHNVKKNNVKLEPTTTQWAGTTWSWGETYIVSASEGDEMYVNANTTNSYGDEYISVVEVK